MILCLCEFAKFLYYAKCYWKLEASKTRRIQQSETSWPSSSLYEFNQPSRQSADDPKSTRKKLIVFRLIRSFICAPSLFFIFRIVSNFGRPHCCCWWNQASWTVGLAIFGAAILFFWMGDFVNWLSVSCYQKKNSKFFSTFYDCYCRLLSCYFLFKLYYKILANIFK